VYTKVYNSITEIEEEKWNGIVARNRIICSYRFLLAVEKSNINDCRYFYPIVYENDQIVAHTCIYSITTDLDTLTGEKIKKIINFIRKFWKNFLTIKTIECGTPVAPGNVISFANNIDKDLAFSYLVLAIEGIAKIKKIGVIVLRDFCDEETDFYDNLIIRRYKRVNNLPNTILKIKWNTFNEYLRNIKSYYRCKIIKKIKVAEKSELFFEISDKLSKHANQLQLLWLNVYNNAKEYKREILTKEFFINLEIYLNGKAKVILCKKDSIIVGFALLLLDDDTLRFMYSGIDYIVNKEYSVYFNSIYHVITKAITDGKKDIDAGLSTYLPKLELGAEMVNLFMYLKHTNKFLNPIITNLFNILTPKINIKNYNIFKEEIENKIVINKPLVYNRKH
jgi:predicted N-acyltransferase